MKSGLWWLIPFDALLGVLSLLLSLNEMGGLRSGGLRSGESAGLITPVACLIDAGIASALLIACFLLLRQKRAAPFQRAGAWALLLRSGLVTAELFLPNEGGMDGILRMGALLVLALLTVTALAAAASLGRQERQEQPPETPVDQSGVSPTPSSP